MQSVGTLAEIIFTMKHFFYTLLFVCTFTNAQEYQFDYEFQYNILVKGENSVDIRFVNSKDDSFYLFVRRDSENNLFAKLCDSKNLKIHIFKVSADGDKFNFEYEKSDVFYFDKSRFKKYDYRITKKESKKEGLDTFQIDIYKNKKSKKSITSINIESKKDANNFFPAFRKYLHPFEFEQSFFIPENYVIVKADWVNIGGIRVNYFLKQMKASSFTLKI